MLSDDRAYWVSVVERIARPVLSALAAQKLNTTMPVEHHPKMTLENRKSVTYLEAIGRLLAGIAPWLETGPRDGDEGKLRNELADLARRSIASAVDPGSPDFMNFNKDGQPLVDTAFLCHGLLRAPTELYQSLPQAVQGHLRDAVRSSRAIRPGNNNWLLFSAMVEAGLQMMGEWSDTMRVDYAVRQHEQWYKGDGMYGDGASFHMDYYNAFVIQPMLIDVCATIPAYVNEKEMRDRFMARLTRYAAIQERLISPEGTLPPVGRSLAYRCGALQALAMVALMKQLPEPIKPAQVRGAMTAVIRRMVEAKGTFDGDGWLQIGFCGHQPGIGEAYISTGSLYLCSVGLLPLGLPPEDEFWSGPDTPWTAKQVYGGANVEADHSIA